MNEKRKSLLFLSKFSRNLKFVLVGSIICGLVIGVVRANIVIHANQYLQNSLYYLSLQILQNSIINSIASIFIILTFVNLAITFGEKGLFIDLLLLLFMYLLFLFNVLRRNLLFIAHPHCFLLLAMGLCGIIFLLHISTKLKKILLFFDKLTSWESVIILVGTILIVLTIYNRSIYFFKNINRSKGPNIILISIDALRPDHLGCYGYHRNTSPNIDRLARQGILFKNAFSQATWTLASHASIFLSQYVWRHKVDNHKKRLGNSFVTMAEILKDRNYTTCAFVGGGLVSSRFGFNQGFEIYEDGIPGSRGRHEVASYIDKLLSWLESVKNRKFFLFIHTYDVHTPYNPPASYFYLYRKGDYGEIKTSKGIMPDKLDASKLTIEEIDYIMAVYDGCINYVDNQLGKIFEKLNQLGIDDNTIIIFTADHGEAFKEHGKLDHCYKPYIELVHVPLIIKGPGVPKNRIYENFVQHIDIAPTILEILNIPQRKEMQGTSLLALTNNYEIKKDLKIYSSGQDLYPRTFSMSLRTKDWAYIMNQNGPDELYDRINDPKEQNNILKKRPLIAQELREELENFIALTSEGKPPVAEKVRIDEELKEQLKSLGYLH